MKENLRVTITKKMLKDSLMALLKEKELDEITVTELCARAQVNRATFYRYYRLPLDVLADIQQDAFEELKTFSEDDGSEPTEEEVKEYLLRLCTTCYDKSSMLNYFLQYDLLPDKGKALDGFFRQTLSKYTDKLEGDWVKMVAAYLSGGTFFILRLWVGGGVNKTPEEMADAIYKFMNGKYSE